MAGGAIRVMDLGAGPKVVQILREGYTLPFGSSDPAETHKVSHSH